MRVKDESVCDKRNMWDSSGNYRANFKGATVIISEMCFAVGVVIRIFTHISFRIHFEQNKLTHKPFFQITLVQFARFARGRL